MARVSPLMIAPPLVFVALAGLFFTSMMRDNADELPSTRVGQAAPDLALEPVPGTNLLTGIDLRDGELTILISGPAGVRHAGQSIQRCWI